MKNLTLFIPYLPWAPVPANVLLLGNMRETYTVHEPNLSPRVSRALADLKMMP